MPEKKDWTTGEYRFRPADPTDSRSPCPALNALANHSIIPHNGRNISFWTLVTLLRDVYTLSFPLAFLVTLGGYILCRHSFTKIDLHTLSRHDWVEHDASLVHGDTPEGSIWAPSSVDERLLEELLDEDIEHRDKGGLTLHTFALARLRRDRTLKKPLSRIHAKFTLGESAFILLMLGDHRGVVERNVLRTWLGEERLPNGWTGNVNGWRVGIFELDNIGKRIGMVCEHIKKGE